MASSAKAGKQFSVLEKRNGTRAILRQPVLLAAILLMAVLLGLFVVYPLCRVLLLSVQDGEGGFTLSHLQSVFLDPRCLAALGRTLLLGGVVSVLATAIGYLFAYTVTRVNVPCRRFFRLMATLPILSPPFILSLSIIFLFGKQGLFTKTLLGIGGNDVYGFWSLVTVQVLSFFPVAYLTISGVLASADPSAEEAARSMGAGRWYTFRTVTLPLSLPGIFAGGILVLIQSMEDFSNPAVIGGAFSTLSVEIYQTITGTYQMEKGAALSLLLLLPTLAAYLLHRHWLGKKSLAALAGKPPRARSSLEEGRIGWLLFAGCMLVSCVILIFYAAVIFGSFVKTWGYDFTLTLEQYRRAFSYGLESLGNSVLLALLSALAGGVVGMVLAWSTAKRNYFGKRLLEGTSVLMFAIPGTVLGIAYILAFNTKPLLLTGTAAILFFAMTFRNMPVAMEAGSAALLQQDSSVDEASAILGAGAGYSFRHITLPLLRQAFSSGMVYAFTRGITAVSAVIFLVSPRWNLVTIKIYALFDEAKYSQAAALVTVLVLILLAFIGILHGVLGRFLAPRSGGRKERT